MYSERSTIHVLNHDKQSLGEISQILNMDIAPILFSCTAVASFQYNVSVGRLSEFASPFAPLYSYRLIFAMLPPNCRPYQDGRHRPMTSDNSD